MLPFLLLLCACLPARGACLAAEGTLEAALDRAVLAYQTFDLERFGAEVGEVRGLLPCLDAPVGRDAAGRVHLVFGLAAWLDQDPRAMAASARGMLVVVPAYEPGPELAPQGSRIRAVFDTARAAGPGPERAVAAPPLWLDGEPHKATLPEERAALLQWRDPGGALQTRYLDGQGLAPELLADLALAAPTPPPARHRSRWLLAGAGTGIALAAGALWGTAATEHAYWECWDPTREARLYAANRALGATGWVSLAGAGGAGLAAVWLWEF